MQDVLDLKANDWIPRTKKEGPKKIEEIHQEAERELQQQAMRDRDERQRDRRGGGGGGDRYGGPPPPRGGGGGGGYDRLLPRDEVPSRPMMANMNRAPSSELSFRPGGNFGAGRGARNASPALAATAASAALSGAGAQRQAAQPAPPSRTATPAPPPQPTMSLDAMKSSGEPAPKHTFLTRFVGGQVLDTNRHAQIELTAQHIQHVTTCYVGSVHSSARVELMQRFVVAAGCAPQSTTQSRSSPRAAAQWTACSQSLPA